MAHPLIELGVVIGAHGLHGLLRIKLFSADPQGLAAVEHVVLRLPDGSERGERVARIQPGPRGQLMLGLDSVRDRAAAEALRGTRVAAPRDGLPPLEPDEFYLADAVGCAAVSMDGEPLGTVVEIGDNGAQPLLYVEDGEERFHVPAVAPLVHSFEDGRLVLDLPDGLREAVAERKPENP